MSEVIAGAVGGVIALIAGIGVQALTARHARRQRIAALGAQLLTHGALLVDSLNHYMERGTDSGADVEAGEVPHFTEAMAAASELSLLGGSPVALRTQAVIGTMNQLTMLANPETPPEEWMEAILSYGSERLALTHAIRKELRRPKLSDDELGHDAPDPADPQSTHQPG